MKAFVAISALLAVASAGLVAPVAYHSGLHVPVLDHNGYQLDTVDVAHAKAAHFAAHAEANARLGHGVVAPLAVAAPLAYAGHYAHSIYAGPQHIPVIGPNGVPLDTPEVAAGKVANAVAHAEAHARNGDVAVVAAPLAAHIAAPVAYASHVASVPLDTAEVAHAKAAHFAAHVEARARNGDLHAYAHPLLHLRKRRGLLAAAYAAPLAIAHTYAGPQHLPVIGPNGVPLDTPEVAAGKVANAVAHAEAHARNGDVAVVATPVAHSVVAPVAHSIVAPALRTVYTGPQHLPVIGPNGVPLDTPEVAAGKVANAVAHAEAHVRNGDVAVVAAPVAAHVASPVAYAAAHGVVAPVAHSVAAPLAYTGHYAPTVYASQHLPVIGPNGVPLDTPEVAAGKVANAVAHAEAHARNGDYIHHY